MRALRRAYAQAGVSPATVGLVEAHGTGTVAGDGAEVEALLDGLRRGRRGTAVVRARLGQVDDRPHQGDRRGRRADQGGARPAPPRAAADDRRDRAEPEGRLPREPLLRQHRDAAVAAAASRRTRAAPASAPSASAARTSTSCSRSTRATSSSDHEPTLDAWPAELLLWRGDSRREIVEAARRARGRAARAAPSRALADLACTLAREAALERAGPSATLAIVAESLADLAQKLRAARGAARLGASARAHARRRPLLASSPLAADGQRRVPLPGPGLAVRQHGPRARHRLPRGARAASSAPTASSRTATSSRSAATSSRRPSSRDEDEKRRAGALTDTHVAQPALGATELAYLHVLRVVRRRAGDGRRAQLRRVRRAGRRRERSSEDDLLRLSEARGRFISEAAGEEAGAMAAVDAAPRGARPRCSTDGGVVDRQPQRARSRPSSRARASAIEAAVAWCRERDIARPPAAGRLRVPLALRRPAPSGGSPSCSQRRDARRRRGSRSTRTRPASRTRDDPAAIAEILGEHLVRPVEFVARDRGDVRRRRPDLRRGRPAQRPQRPRRPQILGDRAHLAVPVDQPGRPGLASAAALPRGAGRRGRAASSTSGCSAVAPSRRCDLARARAASAGAWLVDGGRAWLADGGARPRPRRRQHPTPTQPSTRDPTTQQRRWA